MRVDGLVGPERRLWMEFPFGTHMDLRTGDPEQDDPAGAASWSVQRSVRAEVIRDLLVGRRPVDHEQENEQGAGGSPSVFLSGARITGQLDLRGIDFKPPLLLQGCALDEPLIIADSMSRSVRLYRCRLPGVQGSWLTCSGDLHLRDCQVEGEVDLSGSYLSGQLVLSGSKLLNPGGVAVHANGLVVAGDLFCRDGAEVVGEFSLTGARIGGELRFTDSTLRNPGRTALNAARIVVEKDMYCREGFTTEGEVRLPNGQVKGQLNFNHATMRNHGKVVLDATQLVVGTHLYCQDRFTAEGEISLVAARIGGEIRFSAATTLSNPGGVALRAQRLTVGGDMYCREGLEVFGQVDLRGAHIGGQLNFNTSVLHNEDGVALRADHLVLGDHLYCHDNFRVEGGVSLLAARIGGEVRFSSSKISNPGGTALCADRISVAADMYCRETLEIEGMVSLRSAHIAGKLSFNNAKIHKAEKVALDADRLVVGSHLYCYDDFEVEGGVTMVAARVGGEIRFSGATLSNVNGIALRGDRLVVEKDMYCRTGFEVDGEVSLRGAHVKGKLSFSSAKIRNPGGTAVQADQLTVGGDLCCDEGFTADGLIDLTDAHVAGELSLSDATLSNTGDVVLLAPRLIVSKDMFCRDGFVADGTICLIGAHIGGKLSLTSARLTGAVLTKEQLSRTRIEKMLTCGVKPVEQRPRGNSSSGDHQATGWRARLLPSIRRHDKSAEPVETDVEEMIVSGASGLTFVADGLRVDLDMTCDAGFSAQGEIRLKGARIGQNLDFSDAEVRNGAGKENKIANALNAEDIQAQRMLMPARCEAGRISLRNGKMVELDDRRGVRPDQIDIRGLSYETLIPPLDPETRLGWLANNDYEPQPYDQLARSYRRLGYEDSARKVQLEQERRQRQRDELPRIYRMWGYLQDVTIGYGYSPDRAAILFVLVLLMGVTWFSFFPPQPLASDLNAPQFNSIFYTLDVLVPFADFGQRGLWNSSLPNEIVKVVLAICGWTLAITAIAGINRKLTRS